MKQILLVFTLLFLSFSQSVFASRKLEITTEKTTLTSDESMILSLNFSGFDQGETIYIKGAFFIDGSTNYFGFSQKGDSWIKNSETATLQPSILIDSGIKTLGVKNDPSDSGFHGEGEYKIKAGYYYLTSGGNLSSVHWSENSLPIHIVAPIPTSTPLPTPSPTRTPSPTLAITPKQEIFLTEIPISEEVRSEDEVEEITGESTQLVLGQQTEITRKPSSVIKVKSAVSTKYSLGPFFIGAGFLFLCAILICRKTWNIKFPFEQ